jgi:hypothetical protein
MKTVGGWRDGVGAAVVVRRERGETWLDGSVRLVTMDAEGCELALWMEHVAVSR